ncbi:hypothetical protein GOP47_0019441 [Adiantum capillus-veneris]|uniref:Sulfotransferase n=1 Tax=Adiantum capillus-veneris TaxID=13818 RepID=A0A9D4UB26_ADICA|nr:hypothetical protein GOP47_0019441 [Adiantum capillus-veneris]
MLMAMAWLRASAFLLLGLVVARKVCTHIAGWLSYLWITRPYLVRTRKKRSTTNIFVESGTTTHKRHKLQVIFAGFPRTGTGSLMQALEILGFPCFHGVLLTKPTTARLFIEAFTNGNPKSWEKLLDGYAAIIDFPGTCAYKQLMEELHMRMSTRYSEFCLHGLPIV